MRPEQEIKDELGLLEGKLAERERCKKIEEICIKELKLRIEILR